MSRTMIVSLLATFVVASFGFNVTFTPTTAGSVTHLKLDIQVPLAPISP